MTTIKHLILSGISEISFEDAIEGIIAQASQTIDHISCAAIVSQSVNVTDEQITQYVVDVDLSFIIDNRKD